jgi:hypothetical protein
MKKSREELAEIARKNGAKSKGPKTEAGRRAVADANTKHALYRLEATVLEVEQKVAFNHLRAAAFAQWAPRTPFEAQYVEEIVDCSWRIARLRLVATHETNLAVRRLREGIDRPISYADAITKVELDGSTPQGPQPMIQRRINALIMNRTMIASELRAMRGVPVVGVTQEKLQAKELPPEETHSQTTETRPEPACGPN